MSDVIAGLVQTYYCTLCKAILRCPHPKQRNVLTVTAGAGSSQIAEGALSDDDPRLTQLMRDPGTEVHYSHCRVCVQCAALSHRPCVWGLLYPMCYSVPQAVFLGFAVSRA